LQSCCHSKKRVSLHVAVARAKGDGFKFKLQISGAGMTSGEEEINLSLKKRQDNVENWKQKDLVQKFHSWAEILSSKFTLDTGVPALLVDRLRCTRYGHFCSGRDGFGLLGEIAINELYVTEEPNWRNLATLLHELGHAHQERTGEPGKGNYHNKQYRWWAKTVGLVVDALGHISVLPPPSPFWDVLQGHGVEVPTISEPEPAVIARAGMSKLQLWMCSCIPPIRVRVAIADFQARCLKCGQLFARK